MKRYLGYIAGLLIITLCLAVPYSISSQFAGPIPDASSIAGTAASSISVVLSAQYPTSDAICARAADTSISGVTCTNLVTDAIQSTSPQTFATQYSVLGGLLAANKSLRISLLWSAWTTATTPSSRIRYKYGTALLADTGLIAGNINLANSGRTAHWVLGTVSTTSMVSGISGTSHPLTVTIAANIATQPVTVTTTATTQTIAIDHGWVAAGLSSVVSVTGGTVTGTAGQTCLLTTFNNSCSGSTATATLVGTDTLASATYVVTNTGIACSAAPTTVTITSGTATCSGSGLTTSTTLGGAQGNALRLNGMIVELL